MSFRIFLADLASKRRPGIAGVYRTKETTPFAAIVADTETAERFHVVKLVRTPETFQTFDELLWTGEILAVGVTMAAARAALRAAA